MARRMSRAFQPVRRRQVEELGQKNVAVDHIGAYVPRPACQRGSVERDGATFFLARQFRLGNGAVAGGVLQREQARSQGGKRLQCPRGVFGRKRSRLVIEHAERTDPGAGHRHWHPGIEADVLLARDQGIGGETRIERGVGHHHGIVAGSDGMGAERDAGWRLRLVETDARLEPLAIAVDQAHQRDRRFGDCRRKTGDTVEVRIGRRVHGVQALKHGEPFRIHDDAADVRRQTFSLVGHLSLKASRNRPRPARLPMRNFPEQPPLPERIVPEAPAAAQYGGQE